MKKIKLLTSLAGLSALSMGLAPAIASCSCSSTGLQVELVSKKKNRDFCSTTNACSWTFKTSEIENIKSIKVKLTNLLINDAEVQSVSGLLKSTYDSAGNIKIVINTDTLLSQWPNCESCTFDLLFTNKENGKTCTISGFKLTLNPWLLTYDFETCEWSIITKRIKQYYDEDITLDEFVSTFTNSDQEPYTSINDFIGLSRTIKINGNDHQVKVIDVNHDILVEPLGEEGKITNSLFTFEVFTIISKKNGDALSCPWSSMQNVDYTNSILRKNLTGEGEETIKWSDAQETRTALTMIKEENQDLYDCLKSVTKKVAVNESGEEGAENFNLKEYNDVLFPLTCTELVYNTESLISSYGVTLPNEGTPYQYWTLNQQKSTVAEKNQGRIKYDVNSTGRTWWTGSPSIDNLYNALIVYYDNPSYEQNGGYYSYYCGNGGFCPSFAFCI